MNHMSERAKRLILVDTPCVCVVGRGSWEFRMKRREEQKSKNLNDLYKVFGLCLPRSLASVLLNRTTAKPQ